MSKQASKVPTRKMTAVGIYGALTTVIIAVSRDFFGYEMSGELGSAIASLVAFGAGYFTKNADPLDEKDVS